MTISLKVVFGINFSYVIMSIKNKFHTRILDLRPQKSLDVNMWNLEVNQGRSSANGVPD